MAFGWSAATWIALASAAATAYSAKETRVGNSRALAQQKAAASASQQAADQAQNKANARSPDSVASLAQATAASRGGQAGTMLTGSQGLDASSLTLGKSTLLGGGG